MNLIKCRTAYRMDPAFNRLVNAMGDIIKELQMSPSEVREAAMFAVYLNEIEFPKQSFIPTQMDIFK